MTNGKLADRVAHAIERDLAAGGYREGDKLGTEESLAERHNVGRSVVREALALVEQSGLAYTRRGRGGGLIFGSINAETIAVNLQRYLDFISRDYEEAIALRRITEGLTARLASQRLDEAGLADMQALLAEHATATNGQDLIVFTARMVRKTEAAAKNPMLQVTSLLVGRQTFHHLSTLPERRGRLITGATPYAELRRRLIQAIIGGDVGYGWELVCQIMDVFHEVISASPEPAAAPAAESLDAASILKLYGVNAEAGLVSSVIANLKARIINQQLGEGDLLGSEPGLIAELGVGRGVFRSAVRLLEQLSVVRMAPGKGGGLRVLTPDPRSIIERSSVHLRAIGVAWGHIEELTEVLAPLALEGAMRAATTPADRARIAGLFDDLLSLEGASLRNFAVVYHDILARMSASSSPTLSFLFSLMGATVPLCEGRELEVARIAAVDGASFAPLQVAIAAGEIELARRRLISLTKSGLRFVVLRS